MFDNTKAILFDLDGTLYLGDTIVQGAIEVVQACRASGRQALFLTNNSAKTRKQIWEKLLGMGVKCDFSEIITSGYLSALYVLQQKIERLYVCGTEGLREELSNMGVRLSDSENARNLLIGHDSEFDYEKLSVAVRVAVSADTIIACNKERTYRSENNALYPGCGAIVAAIEWSSNRRVDYIIGKPSVFPLEMICRAYGYAANELLVVGDTFESDILMATRYGSPSALVCNSMRNGPLRIDRINELALLL